MGQAGSSLPSISANLRTALINCVMIAVSANSVCQLGSRGENQLVTGHQGWEIIWHHIMLSVASRPLPGAQRSWRWSF
jgi:hypothetical protein